MALQTWKANYPDPAKQTFFFFSPKTFGLRGNWSYWKNNRCEELCDVVLTELDKNKRARATLEIQKLDVENAVYAYFYQVRHPIAMRDNVEDIWYHPGIAWVASPVNKKK